MIRRLCPKTDVLQPSLPIVMEQASKDRSPEHCEKFLEPAMLGS